MILLACLAQWLCDRFIILQSGVQSPAKKNFFAFFLFFFKIFITVKPPYSDTPCVLPRKTKIEKKFQNNRNFIYNDFNA